MSKRHICKSKFHACYHFLDIYKSLRRKKVINPSCPKHPKIIWNKKGQKFLFSRFFVVSQKSFILSRHQKELWKWKYLCHFPPMFRFRTTRVEIVFCHYMKIILTPLNLLTNSTIKLYFCKISIKRNWHFQRVTAKCYRLFPGKWYQAILPSLSDVNLFWIFIDWDKCNYYL